MQVVHICTAAVKAMHGTFWVSCVEGATPLKRCCILSMAEGGDAVLISSYPLDRPRDGVVRMFASC